MGYPATGYLYVRNTDDKSREYVVRVDHIALSQANYDEVEDADGVTVIGSIAFSRDNNHIMSAVFTET